MFEVQLVWTSVFHELTHGKICDDLISCFQFTPTFIALILTKLFPYIETAMPHFSSRSIKLPPKLALLQARYI